MLAGSPNGSIKVADASIRSVNNEDIGDVPAQVRLNLSPTPRIFIEFDCIRLPSHFNVMAEAFDISLDSGVTFRVLTNLTRYEQSESTKQCRGPFVLADSSVTAIETASGLDEVHFGLINFPAFLAEEYQPPKSIEEFKSGYQRRDFIRLQDSLWVIEVRSLSDTRETIKRLRAEGGYGVTHEGSIRRSDGKPFTTQQVSPLLELLRLFLSFARGAYCGITLVTGMNHQGERVLEKWGSSYSSPWSGHRSWFDTNHRETLTELFPGFWRKLKGAPQHHPIRMALHWYLLSNETHALEGSAVLTQAALERLSQEMVGMKGKRKEGQWIADALKSAGIPTQIPSQLTDLVGFGKKSNLKHGPHTLVEIRNDLVHSDMKHNILSGQVYEQARELGLWYVELMLLRIFGYDGKYGNRLTQEWKGQVEDVPWA